MKSTRLLMISLALIAIFASQKSCDQYLSDIFEGFTGQNQPNEPDSGMVPTPDVNAPAPPASWYYTGTGTFSSECSGNLTGVEMVIWPVGDVNLDIYYQNCFHDWGSGVDFQGKVLGEFPNQYIHWNTCWVGETQASGTDLNLAFFVGPAFLGTPNSLSGSVECGGISAAFNLEFQGEYKP